MFRGNCRMPLNHACKTSASISDNLGKSSTIVIGIDNNTTDGEKKKKR